MQLLDVKVWRFFSGHLGSLQRGLPRRPEGPSGGFFSGSLGVLFSGSLRTLAEGVSREIYSRDGPCGNAIAIVECYRAKMNCPEILCCPKILCRIAMCKLVLLCQNDSPMQKLFLAPMVIVSTSISKNMRLSMQERPAGELYIQAHHGWTEPRAHHPGRLRVGSQGSSVSLSRLRVFSAFTPPPLSASRALS